MFLPGISEHGWLTEQLPPRGDQNVPPPRQPSLTLGRVGVEA